MLKMNRRVAFVAMFVFAAGFVMKQYDLFSITSATALNERAAVQEAWTMHKILDPRYLSSVFDRANGGYKYVDASGRTLFLSQSDCARLREIINTMMSPHRSLESKSVAPAAIKNDIQKIGTKCFDGLISLVTLASYDKVSPAANNDADYQIFLRFADFCLHHSGRQNNMARVFDAQTGAQYALSESLVNGIYNKGSILTNDALNAVINNSSKRGASGKLQDKDKVQLVNNGSTLAGAGLTRSPRSTSPAPKK